MRCTLFLTMLSLGWLPALSGQTDTTAATLTLTFDWPAGLSATVVRSDMRVSTLGGVPDTAGGSARFRMRASEHTQGTLVEVGNFQIFDLDDFRTDYQPSVTLQKVLDGFVPSFIATQDGAFFEFADFAKARTTMDRLLGDLDSLPDLPPGGAPILNQMLSERVFASKATEEWDRMVGAWAGQQLEVGATYEYETLLRPLGDTLLPVVTEFGIGGREPCTADDADSTCVLLWRTIAPRAESMRGPVLDRLSSVLDADASGAFRVESVDVSTSVVVIAEPATLVPYRVEILVHSYYRTRTGTNAPEEASDDALTRLLYVYRPPGGAVAATDLDAAVAVFMTADVAQSIPLFRDVVGADASNPDAHAWLADALRRTGESEEAERHARLALTLDACHAYAHTVLAAIYNPQYRSLDAAHADSVWSHLTQAIECDPDDGNAWLALLSEAVHRGESQWEGSAARALMETEFLSAATLAYQRAVLRALPPNSVLLTAGDLDTYPALALQITEGLRPDVAVVNLSMLNLSWYARNVRDRYSLTLAIDDAALDVYEVTRDDDGTPVTMADSLVRGWRTASAFGALGRPFAIGISTGDTTRFPGAGRFASGGFYYLVHPADGMAIVTPKLVREALDSLGVDALRGPTVSPNDRSPIRNALATPPLTLAGYAGLIYVQAMDPGVLWALTQEDHTEIANITAGFESIGHAWRPAFYDELRGIYAEQWVGLSATAADPVMAADYAGRAIRLSPDLGDARHLFGVALIRNGQASDAIERLHESYADKPLATMLALADALRMSGDFEGALTWSDSAVTLLTPQSMDDPEFMWGAWYVAILPEIPGDAALRQPIPIFTNDEKAAIAQHARSLDLAVLGRRGTADGAFVLAVATANTAAVQCIAQNRITAALGHLELDTDIRTWLIARRSSLDQVNCVMSG